MRKNIRIVSLLLVLMLAMQGCKKNCPVVPVYYGFYQPVFKDKNEVRADIGSKPPRSIKNPGRTYQYGNYILLSEIERGIHVIDNSNPLAPVNRSFIYLPGSANMAIKGNWLYADLYNDLAVVDISNPLSVALTAFIDTVFANNNYPLGHTNHNKIIADWEWSVDTVLRDCNDDMYFDITLPTTDNPAIEGFFKGMKNGIPRFALLNDYLYTVSSSQSHVGTFSLAMAAQPQQVHTLPMSGESISTIFPFKDKLLTGNYGKGLFACDVQNPASPLLSGPFPNGFVTSCDPVIVEGNTAYTVVRLGSACVASSSELRVIDITNVNAPTVIGVYPLASPITFAKDGNLLMVCEGAWGVRVLDVANPANIVPVTTLVVNGRFEQVSMRNGIALLTGSEGMAQYDYNNPANIRQLSFIKAER